MKIVEGSFIQTAVKVFGVAFSQFLLLYSIFSKTSRVASLFAVLNFSAKQLSKMAVVLTEAVVGKLCEMFVQEVANEATMVLNFTKDFKWIKIRIEEIKFFLSEVNRESSIQRDSVTKWLHRVRDIAWDAEDILQECALSSASASNNQSCTLRYSQLILRYKMRRRIRDVKSQLNSVFKEGRLPNFFPAVLTCIEAEPSNACQRRNCSTVSTLPLESVVIQLKTESMFRLLEDLEKPIIAVIGTGGTYLLQKVYDSRKASYDKFVWLPVPQVYHLSKMQHEIAFQLDEDLSKEIKKGRVSEQQAAELIHAFLQEKRYSYLIVLDGVGRAASEGDFLTKLGISTRANRKSKILVSARSKEVAVNLNAEVYKMDCLTDEESWKLFCVHAFPELEENGAPEYLKKVALDIVKECGNLPLAIRTTAATLANTSRPGDWHSKLSKLKKVGLNDLEPVGMESKIERMGHLLENPGIQIIAVVGVGGIGKTCLLQHVYDNRKESYEIFAWLSVSHLYSFSTLLNDLAFQLDEDLCKEIEEGSVSEHRAAELIYGFLLGKKYLIVLDNVWTAHNVRDLLAKFGLPTGTTDESKILISTRSKEVDENLNAEIYEMEPLTDGESWRLFCAYAFSGCEENRAPERLNEVACDMVKKCGNLPLAIKTTAASLANNTSRKDWQSTLRKLKTEVTPMDPVMDNFRLTYNSLPAHIKLAYESLPAHLKACFAYLCFFPENQHIECEYLTYLWRAEEFIPAGQNPWDCLNQLASLYLVEVLEKDWSPIKYCKIHVSFLDLAISISTENKSAFSVEEAFSKNVVDGPWRRLFLAKKNINEHDISERPPVSPTYLRTLSLSRNGKIGGKIPEMLFNGMRVLRVLDLSHTNISSLPACLGKMKLLRVLNLRSTRIMKLPKCVRYLKNLSFLDVSECNELKRSYAPKWISEVKSLQHLAGPFLRMPRGVLELDYLQTLR